MNYTILRGNYDLIHLVENNMKKEFDKFSLLYAILSWDQKIVKYIISNYHYDYLIMKEIIDSDKSDSNDDDDEESNSKDEKEIESGSNKKVIGEELKLKKNDDDENENNNSKEDNTENNTIKDEDENDAVKDYTEKNATKDDAENNYSDYSDNDDYDADQRIKTIDLLNDSETVLSDIIENTFFNLNFRFLISYLLPFFRNNPSFVKKNIYEITNKTFYDHSTYLTSEFMKYPKFNENYVNPNNSKVLFAQLVVLNNSNVVEMLIKNPKINLNRNTSFEALDMSCYSFSSTKIVDLILKLPSLNDLILNNEDIESIIFTTLSNGNVYALKLILSLNPNINIHDFNSLAYQCILENHLLCLKIFIKHLNWTILNLRF